MSDNKAQRKVGIPVRPRGQQTGGPGNPAHARQWMNDTPALVGRRDEESDFFDDESSQMVGAGGTKPRTNTPSVPAAAPTGTPLGESSGEQTFKNNNQ